MPKQWFDVEVGGEWQQVEADSPEQAAELVKAHPLWKATQGMEPPSKLEDMQPYEPGLADSAVGFMQGMGERIGETASGLAKLPAAFYNDPMGTVAGIPAAVVEGAKETAGNLLSGNARQMGNAALDVAALSVPATRAAKVPAQAALRGTGRTLEYVGNNPALAGGIGAGIGYMTGGTPGAFAGGSAALAGRGMINDMAKLAKQYGQRQGRLVKGQDRYMPNTPAASTATSPSAAARPLRAGPEVDPYLANRPASSVAASADDAATATSSNMQAVVDRYMPNAPSSTPAATGVESRRIAYGTPNRPSRAPGSLDVETDAFLEEYLSRSKHGVAGFRNLPNLSPAELARIRANMDAVMRRGTR
jgi:hypothetical protein